MKRRGISSQALIAAAFGAIAVGTFAWAPGLVTQEAQAKPITVSAPFGAPISFSDLIERVEPAVVSVNVVTERSASSGLEGMEEFMERFRGMPGFDDFMEDQRNRGDDDSDDDEDDVQEARSLGSGFFISADGLVVTNNHVIDGATHIEITLEDGRELECELVGKDKTTDLAVLRVKDAGTYPYVNFANTNSLRKGDWVVALGNPFGLGGTATAGILSADGRELGRDSPYTDFLQIDASINRGNSGGPTFDLNGNVIGVNTAIFSPTGGSVGIGFAIPAELAITVTNELIKNGKVVRGWLGVSIQDVTDDIAESLALSEDKGSIISNVSANSPAEKGGLKRGDIILEVNGRKVSDANSTTRLVGGLVANSENSFTVLRAGQRQIIKVTVGVRPDDPYSAVTNTPTNDDDDGDDNDVDGGQSVDKLGVSLKSLDKDTREKLGLGTGEIGLVVTDVTKKGPFGKLGIEPGMAILEVNSSPVSSVSSFEAQVNSARASGRDKILIALRTERATTYLTVDLEEE